VPTQSAGGLAIASLVLGIMSWVCGGILLAIPAVICGKMELNAIQEGRSPESGKVMAQIGFWVGMAHIILTVLLLGLVGIIVLAGVIAGASAPPSGGY
jgi:hypothetical protein